MEIRKRRSGTSSIPTRPQLLPPIVVTEYRIRAMNRTLPTNNAGAVVDGRSFLPFKFYKSQELQAHCDVLTDVDIVNNTLMIQRVHKRIVGRVPQYNVKFTNGLGTINLFAREKCRRESKWTRCIKLHACGSFPEADCWLADCKLRM